MTPSTGTPALLVEAFSDRPCAGNGAGVVLLDEPRPAAWLQAVARSLRQSETAFLLPAPPSDGCGTWRLRWFTPTCEVALCGHGTLAALVALAAWHRVGPGDSVRFLTRSGSLPARLDPHHNRAGTIELPAGTMEPGEPPPGLHHLLAAQGCRALRFWRSSLEYSVALLDANAPLAGLVDVAARIGADLQPALVLMQACMDRDSAPPIAGGPADYQLRFFAPGLGINEDPVTGSAHALVAPLWMEWLGRSSVRGWQCSDRPGGMVCNRLSSGMIALSGAAHVLWEGFLSAPPVACGDPLDDGGWHSLVAPAG